MKKYINLSLCIACTIVACIFFAHILGGEGSVNNCVFCTISAIGAVIFSHHYSESKADNLPKVS